MRKLAGIVGIAGAALLAASCGGDPTEPIDRQVFEDAIVQLRRAEVGIDSTEFTMRRAQILESLALTDSMLYAFVASHASDPEYMAEVWAAIDQRVNGPPPGAEVDTASQH
ncbi:MAG: hypothetical protein PVH00_13825 [Gemmatimonadota bacterium]|jgi:hypothetical protein